MASDSELPPPPGREGGRDSVPPTGSRPPPPHDRAEGEGRRGFAERVVPVIVKRLVERAVESGVEKLAEQPENLRNFISELKLPKEVLQDVYGQIDDTKNGLYRVVAKEIRDVLEQTHVADEIVRALTRLSFEIKTEIRFVPNDSAEKRDDGSEEGGREGEGSLVRPKVTSEVTMRERGRDDRTRR